MRPVLMLSTISLTMISSSSITPAASNIPAITKIETIGSTGLQGFVTTPYLKPGVPKEYWIYGPWLDHAQTITLNGVRMGKLGTGDKMVKVLLVVPPGTPRGKQTLRVTIDCSIFVISDCRNTMLYHDLMVLRTGTVTSVTPNTNITPNQPVTLQISGSNLQNATILKSKSMFSTAMLSERTSSSFKATGTTTVCSLAVLIVGDEAEGGDMYPYGTLSVQTNGTCPYSPPPRTMSGGCPAGTSWNNTLKVCQD